MSINKTQFDLNQKYLEEISYLVKGESLYDLKVYQSVEISYLELFFIENMNT